MATANVSVRPTVAATPIVRGGGIAALASIVLNLIVFGLVRAADITLQIPESAGSKVFTDLPAPGVVMASILSVFAATVLALVLSRFTHRWLRAFQVVVIVLTVLSMAVIFAASTTGGAIVLGVMHVVVGGAVLAAFHARPEFRQAEVDAA